MDNLSRIPLNGLRAAEAVHRLGSLAAAGRELGVSPGAVSQQVARLEETLGLRLFIRRPGGMVAAEGKADIFRLLGQGFDRLSAAVDLTRKDRQSMLTVSCAPIFAARWLIWRLRGFTRANPDIRIRIDSDTALIDPNDGTADFAIRIGNGPYEGVEVERLFPQRIVPVCHADIAATLHSPQDLLNVPIIRDTRSNYGWQHWLGSGDPPADRLPEGPEFSEGTLCLDSAMTGAGVFLSFETLCVDSLKRGQIVAPFPVWRETGASYWLISPQDRSLTLPQRRFRQWLKAAIEEEGMGVAPVPTG